LAVVDGTADGSGTNAHGHATAHIGSAMVDAASMVNAACMVDAVAASRQGVSRYTCDADDCRCSDGSDCMIRHESPFLDFFSPRHVRSEATDTDGFLGSGSAQIKPMPLSVGNLSKTAHEISAAQWQLWQPPQCAARLVLGDIVVAHDKADMRGEAASPIDTLV
jgi:hypothetical protein